MSTYKIGDKVRITKKPDTGSMLGSMNDYCGSIVTISSIYDWDNGKYSYKFKEDTLGFSWSSSTITGLAKNIRRRNSH